MAAKKVEVQMSKVKEYKSCTKYAVKNKGANEVWETIYVQNAALEELSSPNVITVTIEAV